MDRNKKNYFRQEIMNYLVNPEENGGRYSTPTEVLEKVGVDKGNFSSFLRGGTTVSDKKLEQILDELKLKNNPTNKERLALLSSEDCKKEIDRVYANNPLKQYVDFIGWLNAKDPKVIYDGVKGRYTDDAGVNIVADAIFVGEDPKDNSRYLIITESNMTHKDVLISIENYRFLTGSNPLIDNFFNDEDQKQLF